MYGLIIGTPVSLAWIILMRLIASVMVWLSMACLIVLSGYFNYVSYYKYKYYSKTNVIELDKLEDDKLDSLLGTDFIDLINIQLDSIKYSRLVSIDYYFRINTCQFSFRVNRFYRSAPKSSYCNRID